MNKPIPERIQEACATLNILYEPQNNMPIKLTADCYLFYGTEVTEACHNYGQCKEELYYAITGGKNVTILKEVS